MRMSREIFAQPAFAEFNDAELQPGEHLQTDEEIDRFVREKSDSAYHPSSTCKMGSTDDDMTVVDSHCRVVGETMRGLKSFLIKTVKVFSKKLHARCF